MKTKRTTTEAPAKVSARKVAKAIIKQSLKTSAATQSRQDLIDMALEKDDNLTVKDAQRMTSEQLKIAAGIKPTTPEATPTPKVTKKDNVTAIDKPNNKAKACGCGCKDKDGNPMMTKGGRYLPGHDARHHAQLHPSKHAPKPCGCGCKDETTGEPMMTKGGRFLPGHDAKFYSAQLKAEAEVTGKKKAS